MKKSLRGINPAAPRTSSPWTIVGIVIGLIYNRANSASLLTAGGRSERKGGQPAPYFFLLISFSDMMRYSETGAPSAVFDLIGLNPMFVGHSVAS